MPATLKAEFTPIGAIWQSSANVSIVNEADAQLIVQSAPPGFSLRENGLKVEPGYGHRIVGVLKVREAHSGARSLLQRDALTSLRRGAFSNAANAVVDAYTPLAQEEQEGTACRRARAAADFGSGWALPPGLTWVDPPRFACRAISSLRTRLVRPVSDLRRASTSRNRLCESGQPR
jgi:hypothetical protein